MNSIELLSPAKNLQCGIAAINSGADAVYIGANLFGARIKASNNISDIEKLTTYAHKYFAKVYVTLNTLIKEDELKILQQTIDNLAYTNIDAIIFQDMAIAEMNTHNIPLHVSTQNNNSNINEIIFLQNAGFKRVILPRELSLNQITEFRKKTTIELECFIYGAICMSASGICYLSYVSSNRSGNRGDCTQPCRHLYSIYDANNNLIAKDKYILSLKDLNLSDHLEKLIKLGINAFKIEGRLKDIDYVKNITTFYRQKIDIIIKNSNTKKASSGNVYAFFSPNIYKTFNRGYTDYLFIERKKNTATINSPKSIGEFIGIVKKSSAGSFVLSNNPNLSKGDGICFLFNNELIGTSIIDIKQNIIFINKEIKIPLNTKIYRNLDLKFHKLLLKNENCRKINVYVTIDISNDIINISLIDEDGISIKYSENIYQYQTNSKISIIDNIKKQLIKTGNTIFSISNIKVNTLSSEIPFIPISTINHIRRKVMTLLEEERLNKYPLKRMPFIKNNYPYYSQEINYLKNVINSLAEKFYKQHNVMKIEYGIEKTNNIADKNIATTPYCILFELNKCLKNNKINIPIILKDNSNTYKLYFDCKNCIMFIRK